MITRLCILFCLLALPIWAHDWTLSKQMHIRPFSSKIGGLSAIHIHDEGRQFLALSDHGTLFEGHIKRSKNNEIRGAKIKNQMSLFDYDGAPVTGRQRDAEGIAVTHDGQFYVSFEGAHRVDYYTRVGATAQKIATHPHFARLGINAGLEALATDNAGQLYAIAELDQNDTRPFPVFRFRNGQWTQFAQIIRHKDYLITGADITPDGRLYVLERRLRGVQFRSRVRSFAIGEDLGDPRVELETKPGQFGNLEGISLWRDNTGTMRMSLIADNNFITLLNNDLVEFQYK